MHDVGCVRLSVPGPGPRPHSTQPRSHVERPQERFIVISRKQLHGDGHGRGRKRRRGGSVAAQAGAGGVEGGADEEEEGPLKRLKGTVLETRVIEDRKQVGGWLAPPRRTTLCGRADVMARVCHQRLAPGLARLPPRRLSCRHGSRRICSS